MVDLADESRASGAASAPIRWPVVVSILSALAAALLAAGATGLLAHPLRRGLVLAALAAAALADWPGRRRELHAAALLAAALAAVAMVASLQPPINVLAACLILAALCVGREGAERRATAIAAAAVAVLAIWCLARTSIPAVWLGADSLGRALGGLAGWATGRPLWVGSTMAGLDFLVLSAAFLAGWVLASRPPRGGRGALAAGAMVAGQLVYLTVLSLVANHEQGVPAGSEDGWSWAAALATLNPWNLPVLAGAIQLAVIGAVLRWWPLPSEAPARRPVWLWAPIVVLAAAIPAATVLSVRGGSMEGRKVVLYEKGFLNWLRPRHGDYGRLSVGMYGLLRDYLESLGAECMISPDLSAYTLADADLLILLYPNDQWRPEQLQRIHEFVRGGGTLAVFGDHTLHEPREAVDATTQPAEPVAADVNEPSNRINEVLAPTAMRIRFDSQTFTVGGWLHSYQPMAHPATLGLGDDRQQFGVVTGASVSVRYPARPLLIGRWGWNDLGDEGGPAAMGDRRYTPGEKLCDVVMAAEQQVGAGRVIVFGDTSSMTNGITVGAHVFTSRLLAYMADGGGVRWGGLYLVGALCAAALAGLLIYSGDYRQTAAAAVVLAVATAVCVAVGARVGEVLPDGRRIGLARLDDSADRFWLGPRDVPAPGLAYIDTTHLEAFSRESTRPDGTMGLTLTLMRNGYLTLDLPEFTADRLAGASLLVSVAPSRSFSSRQRRILRDWVRGGGTLICTAGYDSAAGSRDMLADFGLKLGYSADKEMGPGDIEPQPMGWFKSTYYEGEGYHSYARYWAAWPVATVAPPVFDKDIGAALPVAFGRGGYAVIMLRHYGKGQVVLVGDTGFAMTKNLEREYGEPIEGMRENADFWRWLLSGLRGGTVWTPPPPPAPAAPSAEGGAVP